MPWSLKNFLIKRIAVVDSGDNKEAEVVLFKSKEEDLKDKGGGIMTLEELYKEIGEDKAKLIKDEIKVKEDELVEKDKTIKELEKNQKEPVVTEPTDEELLKSVDPKIRERLEKAEREAKEAKDKSEQLQKEKDEKDVELKKEALSKEAEQFKNIGATKEDLVEIFTKIDKTGDTELMEKVKAILSADNTALEGNPLTKAKGSDKDSDGKKVTEEVEAKADELRKVNPNLTKEQAIAKVYKDNPELMQKEREEE